MNGSSGAEARVGVRSLCWQKGTRATVGKKQGADYGGANAGAEVGFKGAFVIRRIGGW